MRRATTEVTAISTAVIRMPGTTPPSSSRPIETSLMKPNRISPILGGMVAVITDENAITVAVKPRA